MPICTKGLNPQLAAVVSRLAFEREAAGLRVIISRPDGTAWDGYFRNPAEREEFMARACRMGLAPRIA